MPGGLADLAAQPQVFLWEGGYFRGNGRKAESIAGSFYGTLSDDAADVPLKKKTRDPFVKRVAGFLSFYR